MLLYLMKSENVDRLPLNSQPSSTVLLPLLYLCCYLSQTMYYYYHQQITFTSAREEAQIVVVKPDTRASMSRILIYPYTIPIIYSNNLPIKSHTSN